MNNWFQFKQFTIYQDKCAMKVCTDACILGAWVANKIETGTLSPNNILDIGTGTGLLSLMLAQKTGALISAVEINTEAFLQAKENIERSPWGHRITVQNKNILDPDTSENFDLIICNPPFYNNALKSPDTVRNEAMHSGGLSFAELALSIKQKLSAEGKAGVLLPFHRLKDLADELVQEQLFIEEELHVAHSPKHKFFRAILLISQRPAIPLKNTFFINDETGRYSEDFTALLKDYYLKL